MSGRPIVIDTDPGLDDAMALLLALRSPELDVRALTIVHGNASVEQCAHNARRVLHVAGRCDVPVVAGATAPLLRERLAGWVGHGPDGLGDIAGPACAAVGPTTSAVRFLVETLAAAAEPVTLVPIGPLTNVALLLAAAPELKPRIREIVAMGGAVFCAGNRTAAAEFNVLADPEAARIVFHAGVRVLLVGLDVTGHAKLREEHVRRLESAGNPAASFAARAARYLIPHSEARYGEPAVHLHDPLAIGALLDRSLVRTRRLYVDVETASGIALGKTLPDPLGVTGRPPNVEVCVELDAERFVALFLDRLS
jgi:pyrimidine-specific ribonucleoside hydrolase